jgi:hydroxypyruvate reductase
VRCLTAGHPIPDARGLSATRRLIEVVRQAGPLLFLLSGGASSLLIQPRPPVSLPDKIALSRLLLDSGASITEFNTVRKHLSLVKGGGLLRYARDPIYTLMLSDVIGDDAAVIGSGPTVPDATTFGEALDILRRYDLVGRAPASVLRLLEAGCRGEVSETVKPDEPEAGRALAAVVGSNRTALAAAARLAEAAGWRVRELRQLLSGDTHAAARLFAWEIEADIAATRTDGDRRCLLAGGETTVRVIGGGRGGRNQEFALALAGAIQGRRVAVLSAGSDGIDGPTDAAGAFVDGSTLVRAKKAGLDAAALLAANDSYRFFERLGDLFRPGPTGTNVMDIKIALVGR